MEAWEKVKIALEAIGFKPSVATGTDAYKGRLLIGRVQVEIELAVPDYEFNTLPVVYVRNAHKLPKKLSAHVTTAGTLCYAEKATFLLDRFAPAPSIMRVIEQVKVTLNTLLHGNPTPEYMAEFASYWGGAGYCLIDDPWSVNQLTFGSCDFGDGPQLLVAGRDMMRLKEWTRRAQGEFLEHFTAPVVTAVSDIKPPAAGRAFMGDVLGWLEPQVNSAQRLIDLVCTKSRDLPSLVVVANNAIIGFQAKKSPLLQQASQKGFRKSSLPSLWKAQAPKIEIDPFYCALSTVDEISARNLNGDAPLTSKSVALIGCGTIGGYLARALVQLGAGSNERLLLIDNDSLKPENLGRHALGARWLWKNKAKALCDDIIQDFPDAIVSASQGPAQASLERLVAYDLVIDATGDEQLSNTLNAFALKATRDDPTFPPVLFSMIFGNGIAAQSFLSTWRDDKACFRCLKPIFGDNWRFNPIKSNASSVDLVVRPCAQGSFTPFSVSASLGCASLTAQHAADVFNRSYSGDLRTICFDPQNCINHPWRSVSASENCPACGKARIGGKITSS